MKRFRPYLYILTGLFLCLSAVAQSTRVTAYFEPDTLEAGRTGDFVLRIEGSQARPSDINIQPPPDLNFEKGASRQRHVSLINGDLQVTMRYRWSVTPAKPGTYRIPPFSITLGNTRHTVEPSPLKVVEADQPVFLELELDRDHVYVGEKVRANLKLYVRHGTRMSGPAGFEKKKGDAFTKPQFPDMRDYSSEVVQRKGETFDVHTWPISFTPLKSGSHTLEIATEVLLPSRRRNMNTFDSFFRMQRGEPVALNTGDEPIDVRPLPQTNQPTPFTGAVGLFAINGPVVDPKAVQVGEPLTLSMLVEGTGNLDSIRPVPPETNRQWRLIEPDVSHKTSGKLGQETRARIDYLLIPKDKKLKETPPIRFNYFNPETEKYVEVELPSQPIAVQPAPAGQQTFTPPVEPDETKPQPPENSSANGTSGPLLPNALEPGKPQGSIRPVVVHPSFWGLQGVLLAGMVGWAILRRQQLRHRHDPSWHRRKRLRREWQNARKRMAASDSGSTFLEESAYMLQVATAMHGNRSPESLTPGDIETILAAQNAPDELRREVREWLEAADASRYGGFQSQLQRDEYLNRIEELSNQIMRL